MKKTLIGFMLFILLLNFSCSGRLKESEKEDFAISKELLDSEHEKSNSPDTYEKFEDEHKETKKSYKSALSDEDISKAKELAIIFYKKTVWELISIDVISDEYPLYDNEGIEANYEAGEIIIFHVKARKDNEVFDLTISVAKIDGKWQVINNGYKLY